MAARKPLNIADWVETQNKEYAPSSLDRYLSHPDSPSSGVPQWEQSSDESHHSDSPSSSHLLHSPSAAGAMAAAQYAKGEMVAVRCNRHKWLLGEVRRLSRGGVRVWVGEAGLLVNVPMKLLASHLHKMSSPSGEHSLPPPEAIAVAAIAEPASPSSGGGAARFLVQCVRPAHLSHRKLYLAETPAGNACAICGQGVIVEDDAVAPWDCEHDCHIDCIQDKPRFFSTMSCPVCSSSSSSSASPASPPPHAAMIDGPYSPPLRQKRAASAASTAENRPHDNGGSGGGGLKAIAEDSPELRSPMTKLKPALKKGSVSFSFDTQQLGPSSSSSSPPPPPSPDQTSSTPSPASSSGGASGSAASAATTTSLAVRMKKFGMGAAAGNQARDQAGQWLTVIQDGQDTRQTASQQRLEHMARAKENTFSAKAKQQQQQQRIH